MIFSDYLFTGGNHLSKVLGRLVTGEATSWRFLSSCRGNKFTMFRDDSYEGIYLFI